jgi:hypothetical protein
LDNVFPIASGQHLFRDSTNRKSSRRFGLCLFLGFRWFGICVFGYLVPSYQELFEGAKEDGDTSFKLGRSVRHRWPEDHFSWRPLLTMTKGQVNALALSVVGLLLLLTNKPFGELCRRWQIMMFHRDYGIRSFQVPAIIIGALLLIIGVSFFFF